MGFRPFKLQINFYRGQNSSKKKNIDGYASETFKNSLIMAYTCHSHHHDNTSSKQSVIWAATSENRSSGIPTRSNTTGLYRHRRWLETWNFRFRKQRDCTIQVAKTKTLISFAVTAKLICVFVFAHAKIGFSRRGSYVGWSYYFCLHEVIHCITVISWATLWVNMLFTYAKTKVKMSCTVTTQLIRAFGFCYSARYYNPSSSFPLLPY